MAMTVNRRKDSVYLSVITNKVADVRGGVSIATSELGGNIVREGAVITAPDTKGVCHLVKTAALAKAATTTDVTLVVETAQNFNVGDVVMAAKGGKAIAITKIERGTKTDVITLSATLGVALKVGDSVAEAASAKDTGAALKYVPFAIVGTGKEFSNASNLITDAWIFATTKGNKVPSFVASELKGVINY